MELSEESIQLANLVQALPQELYDDIYILTFTFEPGTIVDLDDETNKAFPSIMQVDRFHREEIAKIYYSTACFTCTYKPEKYQSRLYKWANTLSRKHNLLVWISNEVTVKVQVGRLDKSNATEYVEHQKQLAVTVFRSLEGARRSTELGPLKGICRLQMWLGGEEGVTTELYGVWREKVRNRFRGDPATVWATMGGSSV